MIRAVLHTKARHLPPAIENRGKDLKINMSYSTITSHRHTDR